MSRVALEPASLIFPTPVVMGSCRDRGEKAGNIITIAWTGILSSAPPHVGIAIRPERYSFQLIKESGEFVINLPSQDLVYATDYCGVNSGRDVDKFAVLGLTAAPATKVDAPMIAECPVNLECRVKQVVDLGAHHYFISEVVATHAREDLVLKHGRVNWEKAGLIAYRQGEYMELGKVLGVHGFSHRSAPQS